MDIRKLREHLGRIKIYYLKGDTLKALGSAVAGLKELGAATPPIDVRGALREGIQMLARDEAIKGRLKAPLIYQPGKERDMLALLEPLCRRMEEEAGQEPHDTALARKQRIDQALALGVKLLAKGQTSEADAAFQEAVKCYRTEHTLFQLIARALLEAGQARRAFPYAKKAVELLPESAAARELYARVAAERANAEPAA